MKALLGKPRCLHGECHNAYFGMASSSKTIRIARHVINIAEVWILGLAQSSHNAENLWPQVYCSQSGRYRQRTRLLTSQFLTVAFPGDPRVKPSPLVRSVGRFLLC